MNYYNALKYLSSLKEKNKKFFLKPMQELVKAANLNLSRLRIVHVAGSDGKGSTTAFISSILKENGYRVGTYTSPHLVSIRERIKINGKNISEKDFAKKISEIRNASKKMKNTPSYFETVTAAALKHFLEKQVDFAVVEVGLGGRLDATNILHGLVNVITNISLEHTQVLGNTIQKIAWEKAHIIKENSFTVAFKKNPGFPTIKKFAENKNSKMISPSYKIIFSNDKMQKFDLLEPFVLKNAAIKMLGEFQVENASLALSAVYCLQKTGHKFEKKAILNGLKKTLWPARLQIVQKNPLTIIDSTHTVRGAQLLKKTLERLSYKKLVLVFSCLKDKNFEKILKTIPFETLIATTVNYKRALNPKKI
ncbi:MAG: bifunctional folylpolyglutamate synthase/dihydrofolate synthase, partial [Candidatus Diapherotrites archaeon]|nr:bifunctional folylpolyglutamate synthase/dihydrofolate synthase [Candidatus Diapherotrites archaeon]